MIHYDVTKMGGRAPRSGLTRLSARLQHELRDWINPVAWDAWSRSWRNASDRRPARLADSDWLFTVELFSEAERPGFRDFLAAPPCRLAAMFHDAIPLRFPHITWPQSVQRHAEYMKLLAGFERTWAISRATREEFLGFWRWQGVAPRGAVGVVELGADFDGAPRATVAGVPPGRPALLAVGIVEPRKNQEFLLDVAEALWRRGVDFDLHVVGRVNPHFGRPAGQRMRELARREKRFRYHAAAPDGTLQRLYAEAAAVVLPTVAEGCGLPLLEALWRGVPCVCSDLPVLRENADGGGCVVAPVGDGPAWVEALRGLLADRAAQHRLREEAVRRPLPRWADTAAPIRAALG
ncbi:MAG TPA: glycosyltransferase [Opitutaceae bacterium]|nr:glycosyltransferase [Opitutaceae bacterium]